MKFTTYTFTLTNFDGTTSTEERSLPSDEFASNAAQEYESYEGIESVTYVDSFDAAKTVRVMEGLFASMTVHNDILCVDYDNSDHLTHLVLIGDMARNLIENKK
jgi:hypothetical protein